MAVALLLARAKLVFGKPKDGVHLVALDFAALGYAAVEILFAPK